MKQKFTSLRGRTRALLIIAAVVLLFAGLYILSRAPKIGPLEGITEFYLEYSETGDENDTVIYRLAKLDDGSFTAKIELVEGDRLAPTVQECTVDEGFVQRVEELLAKHHVRWWKGYYESATKSDSGLLANRPYVGRFYVALENGTVMHSQMSGKPWNFMKVWDSVGTLYAELFCG